MAVLDKEGFAYFWGKLKALFDVRPKAVLSAITATVNMADLQAYINSLPKILQADVTITVNPGTASAAIEISRFSGSGTLTINGAAALASTHNMPNLSINRCTNQKVAITGFNITSTATGVNITNNTSDIHIRMCRIVAGTSSIGENRGITAGHSANCFLYACEISNKEWAVLSLTMSRMTVEGLSGAGNAGIYLSQMGGIIHLGISGSIAGTTRYTKTNGGFIINEAGVFA